MFCIPLKMKTAQEVIQTYMRYVYSKFSGSEKILSDNGTEFKNKLFKDVAKQLGVEYKVYTPPYRSQCNGKIEGFHKYLKSCIAKCNQPNVWAIGPLIWHNWSHRLGQVTRLFINACNVNLLLFFFNIVFRCFSNCLD